MKKGYEYTCAMCGKKNKAGRDDEETWKEHDENFPGADHETTEIVCDDCYRQMIKLRPPLGMK